MSRTRSTAVAAALTVASIAGLSSLVPKASFADDEKPLAPADVVSVMSSRRFSIRKKCYESRADKADTSIRVDFSIAVNGVVTDAVAHEASGPQPIIDCVVAEVRKTVFPSSGKGGRFRWPFIFKGP